jgi:hypothetical protein
MIFMSIYAQSHFIQTLLNKNKLVQNFLLYKSSMKVQQDAFDLKSAQIKIRRRKTSI